MQRTRIEWVKNPDGSQGYVWNPIKGLCPQGCWYCYARKIYQRFHKEFLLTSGFRGRAGHGDFFLDEKELNIFGGGFRRSDCGPKKRAGIFVCSTFEIFHPQVKTEWREQIFRVIEKQERHRFYILTKLPENIDRPMPENIWLGVTVTGVENEDRLRFLRWVDATIKFVSFEPLLGDVAMRGYNLLPVLDFRLNWIIVGQLTGYGNKLNPTKANIQRIVKIAKEKNIPIFLKNNLKEIWGEPLIQEMPE